MTATQTPRSIFQCIPNFSEGRRPETVAAFLAAADNISGVRVIDWSMDPDHNRSVITLLGEAQPIHDAVMAMAEIAVTTIDLRAHTGVHPRVGAIDVVPVVPIGDASREDADLLAHSIGASLAQTLDIPVYYYEWSALPRKLKSLPEVRRLLKSALPVSIVKLKGDLAPDAGPSTPHATAGITVVGARGPLAAYNIDLLSDNIHIAKTIAHTIRLSRNTVPYLAGVRALGLYLPSRNRGQVSMNLTQPDSTPLPAIWEFVRNQARVLGTGAAKSEVIGVIAANWLGGASPEDIYWSEFSPGRLLENWMDG